MLKLIKMKNIITSSLKKSLTYAAYRSFVTEALTNNPDALAINSDYLPYAQLNETRLKRLDKTMKVAEPMTQQLKQLKKNYLWVVISESWCGDAAQSLPVMDKLAEATEAIELKVVFRDQNLELMDLFLTNGGRSIPKLLILDRDSLEVLADWGPRPEGAQQFITDYKAAHGSIDEEGKTGLQLWYTKDKGEEIKSEIMRIMLDLDSK